MKKVFIIIIFFTFIISSLYSLDVYEIEPNNSISGNQNPIIKAMGNYHGYVKYGEDNVDIWKINPGSYGSLVFWQVRTLAGITDIAFYESNTPNDLGIFVFYISTYENNPSLYELDESKYHFFVVECEEGEDWYLICLSGQATLPVVLSAFTSVYYTNESGNEFVSVNWSTASETDVQGFNIYRSEYEDLSTVGNHINNSLIPGAGTTTEPQHYSFIDDIANPYKTYYYWLESVDYGGIPEYYEPVKYVPGDIDGDNEVDLYSSTILYNNYPNPAIHTTTIKYQLKGSVIEQDAKISIYNIKGELVKAIKGKKGIVEFDVSNLATGIYFYQLKTNNYNEIKKMIVIQ